MSDDKPFARVVPADGRYYKVGGVIAKPSAPQDAEGDVRTINAAVTASERKAAAKALREAAAKYDAEPQTMSHWSDFAADLRAEADKAEKGER